jgi:pimeloyl-ACP methyl ester carboxylesterase
LDKAPEETACIILNGHSFFMRVFCKFFLFGILPCYLLLTAAALWPIETVPVAQLAGKEARFVKVGGLTIHYEKTGQGKPLVLVHGFAGSIYTWRRLVPLLADRFTIYALDLPGFGLSEKPTGYNYDMQTQGRTVLGFMDSLGLKTASLAGHSMGGVVAACTAIEAPGRVESLVLIEPGFYSSGTPAFLSHLFFPLDRLMARLFHTKKFCSSFLKGSYYDTSLVTDEVIDAYLVPAMTPGAVDALTGMYAYAARKNEDITGAITCPALIIWGENRRSSKINAKLQAASRNKHEIRDSKLVLVPECGHYVQEEKPSELARAMRDFLPR